MPTSDYQEILQTFHGIINPNGGCLAAKYNAKNKAFYPICGNRFNKENGCRIKRGAKNPCKDCSAKDYQPVTEALLHDHFAGKIRLAIYPLQKDRTSWVAADLDGHTDDQDPASDVRKAIQICQGLHIPFFVFSSNSGAGFHLYLFFSEAIHAFKGRVLLLTLLERAGIDIRPRSGSFDAVFPKQDCLNNGDLGNLIAIPYNGRAIKERKATLLLDPATLEPFDDNVRTFLEYHKPLSEADVGALLKEMGVDPEKRKERSKERPTDTDGVKWNGKVRSLHVSNKIRMAILDPPAKGDRSEEEMAVLVALVKAGLSNAQIFSIFEQNPIGDRYRERGENEKWLQDQIDKARDYRKQKEEADSSILGEGKAGDFDEDNPLFKDGKPKKHKQAALVLAPRLQDLRFEPVRKGWREFSKIYHYWDAISDHRAAQKIDGTITSICPSFDYDTKYRKGVTDQLSLYLHRDDFKAVNGTPFKNGFLNQETMNLEPHRPDHFLTWQLPFDYQPEATCQPVQDWLYESVVDEQQVQLLRAYLNAILRGLADIHRYLELVGPGGSGKGTFLRLAESIVGKANVHITELKHLENNRFETAKLYGKRLVTITDAEKYSGDVSTLKAITGGDSIRFEEKHKQNGTPFRYRGMVLIAANQDIRSGDLTSGLQRRRITVRFENVVPAEKRRDLEAEFEPYLPGVINWALAMPADAVKDYLVNTSKCVRSLAGASRETLINTNNLAAWADENLVYNQEVKTSIGRKIVNETTREIQNVDFQLFANFCQWCRETNNKEMAINRFVPLLKDLLIYQLKLPGVKHSAERDGKFFYGVRMRRHYDDDRSIAPSPLDAFFHTSIGECPF